MRLATRRTAWLGAAAALGTATLLVGVFLPVPFVELAPGPTYNTLGEADGKPIISIQDQTTYPTSGNLDLTTVNERGGPGHDLHLSRVLVGWADPAVKVVPREAFYPDDVNADDVEAETTQQWADSESDAVAAALRYLDKPVTAVTVVTSVLDGSPSDGKIHAGDELLAIDGVAITSPSVVTSQMAKVKPGDDVVVRVKPHEGKGEAHDVTVTTTHAPDDPQRAFLGIGVGVTYVAPFPIDIQLGGVGGPSAGTMLSLGIIDKLTPGQLNGGKHVAGTGTISPDGTVGPIGGIAQKMVGASRAGATLFLAPASNCDDVRAADVPSGLTVARIATLADAVTAIESYVAGKPVLGCTAP